jgi:hypothetical protein
MKEIVVVEQIMSDFLKRTAPEAAGSPGTRYLWTDAFAVCNFLELFHRTGNREYLRKALNLVDEVHRVLGRHRADDSREGWISGLDEEEGRKHPTIGGLRIGKKLNERQRDEPHNTRLEWEQDGQYFHYLTKWMHALNRVTAVTGDFMYNRLAIELAKTAHSRFSYTLSPDQPKRMYWKMSIDLSHPLVSSMGHHDPLDGFIIYNQIQATAAAQSSTSGSDLISEIADIESLCRGKNWTTDDPLGLGSILCHAYIFVQLMEEARFNANDLLKDLLESSLAGLDACMLNPFLRFPAGRRLAFREFGLSIGLHAVERIEGLIEEKPHMFGKSHSIHSQIGRLRRFAHLGEAIEKFWLDPQNRTAASWTAHQDINSVMLATSLAPDGYLKLLA